MIKQRINRLYWQARIIWLSLFWIRQVNLGDEVRYQGRTYCVSNGVRSSCWRLSGLKNNDDGWVPRAECKKVITVTHAIKSFKSGRRFYTINWLDIWCREGIKPWMRLCNIWPRKQD